MDRLPRISIVTPVLDRVDYLAEAIESVQAQKYPDVEHIVVDDGSSDARLEVLRRYPHLHLVVEPVRNRADAVNKALRLATGDVWGVLHSDDVLLPGALHRVAGEIDPARGRHVVMGRCRFADDRGRFIGVEHPCHFESHRRVLEVWKGQTIPHPAVFWSPDAWRTSGPMDAALPPAWVDYDLSCRFSRRYRFHPVDQVLVSSHLRLDSSPERWAAMEPLDDGIRVSRRYWGSRMTPTYWALALSLAVFELDRVGRARRILGRAQDEWRRGRWPGALSWTLAGAMLAPEVVFYVGVYPRLRDRGIGIWKKAMERMGRFGRVPAETAVYLDRTDAWADGWVGPRLRVTRDTEHAARALALRGWADVRHLRGPLVLTVRVDSQVIGRHRVRSAGDFAARIRLAGPLAPGSHTVEVEANAWFVPDRLAGNKDFRPLAWRMAEVELEAAHPSP